jgi:hypothetical protein
MGEDDVASNFSLSFEPALADVPGNRWWTGKPVCWQAGLRLPLDALFLANHPQ